MADLDYSVLVNAFKQIAADVNNSKKPFAFAIGKVMSPEPSLKIMVDQKLILGKKQLILTNAVRDYYVKLTTVGETLNQEDGKEHVTEEKGRLSEAGPSGTAGLPGDDNAYDYHAHGYKGDKWWKFNMKLQVGESVLLLRTDGGQKYIVLDRIFPPNNKGEIK